jgi:hypothetical protein
MGDPAEVKATHDHLLTAEELARRLGMDKALILEAQIAARHAEVRLGEMCEETEPEQGKRTDLTSSHDDTKLERIGPPMQRHRWQTVARWVRAERQAFDEDIEAFRKRQEDAFTAAYLYGQAMAWAKHKNWAERVQGLEVTTNARTIVADPPWPYEDTATRGAATDHYETMTLEEIIAYEVNGIPVCDMAAEQAHLYLWTPGRHLREGQAADVVRRVGGVDRTLCKLHAVVEAVGVANACLRDIRKASKRLSATLRFMPSVDLATAYRRAHPRGQA